MQVGALRAVAQVADEDHRPYEDHKYRRHRGDQRERLNNRVASIEQGDTGEQQNRGKEQCVAGHTAPGKVTEELRGVTFLRKTVHHARSREDTRVRR